MSLPDILLIAVGMAMDAFAVSIGIGTTRVVCAPRPVFRLSFHFGLFQFIMPILGWLAGSRFASYIAAFDHWVALALLAFVGGRMIRSGLNADAETFTCDPSRGRMLMTLSIATSIDAFAIGLSLAMLQVDILYPSLVIGIVTATLSLVGILIGHRLGEVVGKRMEVVGGLILIGIGVRIVLSHIG